MNTLKSNAVKAPQEPCRFTKRLGSTTYHVVVHFNPDTKETAGDKIARLVRNETANRGPREVDRLCGGRRSSGVSELSPLGGSERCAACDDEKAVNL